MSACTSHALASSHCRALVCWTQAIENKFYGLYNLHVPSTHFMIVPQYATAEAPAGGTGAIIYVIEPLNLDSPIFFVEIKAPTHLPSISDRKEAETQVRTRFCNLPISSEYRSCMESAL
jgi:hypothetical protein